VIKLLFLIYAKPYGILYKVSSGINNELLQRIHNLTLKYNLFKSLDSLDYIFNRQIWYHFTEFGTINYLKKRGDIKFYDVLIIKLIRLIISIIDFSKGVKMFLFSTFYLSSEKIENNNENSLIITYTNNHLRQKHVNGNAKHNIIDLIIKNNIKSSYKQIDGHIKISFPIFIDYIIIKYKYPYLKSYQIYEVLVGKILFEEFLKKNIHKYKFYTLIQENTTPINKTLVSVSSNMSIKTTTYYTNSLLHDPLSNGINIFTDNCIIPFKSPSLKFNFPIKSGKLISLNGNPFIKWNQVLNQNLNNRTRKIGIIPDINDKYHVRKKLLADKIYETLSLIDDIEIYVRPHPQTLNSKTHKAHYKSLKNKYRNLSISNDSDIDKFLSEISFIIIDTGSTVVEQALLCGVPVIIVEDNYEILNEHVRKYAGEYIKVCKTKNEIQLAVNELLNISKDEIAHLRKQFLKAFNINELKNISIDDLLDQITD
jgi:hypothetical protein